MTIDWSIVSRRLADWLLKQPQLRAVERGGRVDCRCPRPGHDDSEPSFSYYIDSTGWACGACGKGKASDLIRELNLGIEGVDIDNLAPTVLRTYDYKDERGELLYQVLRMIPKSFRQRAWKSGEWVEGPGCMNGVRRVPYRLPEILAAQEPGATAAVLVVDGEKDADAAWALGVPATCHVGGMGRWTRKCCDILRGIPVVIIADKDAKGTGQKDAAALRRLFLDIGTDAPVIELPGDKVKDLSDWIGEGGTREGLIELLPAAGAGSAAASAAGEAEEIAALLEGEQHDPGPFPGDEIISMLNGPMLEVASWIVDKSRREQPPLAVAATLALFSASIGRRMMGPNETRPQMFVVALAESGDGKDVPKTCVSRILHYFSTREELAVGVLGESPFNRAQLDEDIFVNKGQLLLLIDEFGSALKQWTDSRQSGRSGSISPVIRELLTMSQSVFHLTRLGPKHPYIKEHGEKWRRGIFAPSTSVFGLSTPEAFFRGLTEESLTDGLAGRAVVIVAEEAKELREPTTFEWPDSLTYWMEALCSLPVPSTDHTVASTPFTIPYEPDARAYFRERTKALDLESAAAGARGLSVPRALLRRAPGQLATLSFVIAAGSTDDPRKAAISRQHIEVAERIVLWSARFLSHKLQHGVAEDDFSKAWQVANSLLLRGGPSGVFWSRITQRLACKRFSDRLEISFRRDPRIQWSGQKMTLKPKFLNGHGNGNNNGVHGGARHDVTNN